MSSETYQDLQKLMEIHGSDSTSVLITLDRSKSDTLLSRIWSSLRKPPTREDVEKHLEDFAIREEIDYGVVYSFEDGKTHMTCNFKDIKVALEYVSEAREAFPYRNFNISFDPELRPLADKYFTGVKK